MSTDLNRTNQTIKPTRYVLPAILVLGLGIFFLSGAYELVTWQAVGAHYANLNSFVEAHLWLSYMIFMLGYAVVVAFSLPIALPLTLTGGALLGWPAVILVICGATAGAGVVFIAARSFSLICCAPAPDRSWPGWKPASAGTPFLSARFTANSSSALLGNIAPALTSMRLGTFLLATFIGITPEQLSSFLLGVALTIFWRQARYPTLPC